jgi:hypothetical protein
LTEERSKVRPSTSRRSTARKIEGESAQDFRHVAVGCALAGAAEHERRPAALPRRRDRLHGSARAYDQHIGIFREARGGAEPGELARIELHIRIAAEEADERHVAPDDREARAVARRADREIVRGPHGACPRHVLHHDHGVAGNVAGEMARDDPGGDVITAARAVADDEVDVAGFVEVLDGGLRVRWSDQQQHRHAEKRV